MSLFWSPGLPSFPLVIWGSHFAVIYSSICNMKNLRLCVSEKSLWDHLLFLFLPFVLIMQRYSTCSINHTSNCSRCRAPATLCVWVPRCILTFWGDLIAFDDALSLIRLEQQCYLPALLSSAFWKIVEKDVCCPITMFP